MSEHDKPKKPTFQGSVVRQLAEILNETNLTEIEYEVDGSRIWVARQPAHVKNVNGAASAQEVHYVEAPAAPKPAEVAPAEAPADPAKHPGAVKSPMVGTAYLSPSPDDPTFVQVGNTVKEGDTLMIIEAMKVMNPIRATKSGKVSSILVHNAEPVEYGQPLAIIE